MTETQKAPVLPPFFPDSSYRRLPPPIALASLSAPPPSHPPPSAPAAAAPPARSAYSYPPAPHAPPVASSPQQGYSSRPYSASGPPPAYSFSTPKQEPLRSPRSAHVAAISPAAAYGGTSIPPGPPGPATYEGPRPPRSDPAYQSPVEPPSGHLTRPSLSSPSYVPGYAPPHGAYQPPVPEHVSSSGPSLAPPVTPGGPVSQAPPTHPPSNIIGLPPELDYHLRIRQQPLAARACGFGERDRRVIDPPPIVQLEVVDKRSGRPDVEEMRHAMFHIACTLYSEDCQRQETEMSTQDGRAAKRLMGQVVASGSIAKDEHDVEGMFFCFPDLSCRTNGRYRLKFSLFRIDTTQIYPGAQIPIAQTAFSEIFTVYTAKDFPGMRPSSALTRALKHQGCNIQVKKGNEKALAARKRANPHSDDDEAFARRSSPGPDWKRVRT